MAKPWTLCWFTHGLVEQVFCTFSILMSIRQWQYSCHVLHHLIDVPCDTPAVSYLLIYQDSPYQPICIINVTNKYFHSSNKAEHVRAMRNRRPASVCPIPAYCKISPANSLFCPLIQESLVSLATVYLGSVICRWISVTQSFIMGKKKKKKRNKQCILGVSREKKCMYFFYYS